MNDRPSPVSGACLSAVPALIGSLNVAVVLHLFYEDQWPEFRDAMTNIRHPFQLFVSLRPESTLEAEILLDHPTAVVRKVANLGRDVAPFLAFLPQLQAYDAVCKLHSKRSQGGHEAWRLSFCQGLLGSPETAEAYLEAFARDPDLALAGPRLWYIDGRTYLGQTEQALTLQHGVLPTGWGFFAGTMFWCNPRAFAGLDRIYPQDVFTAHTDTDGHPEHALERVFGLIVYQMGKKILLWDGAATLDLATNMRPGLKFSETYRDLSLISDDAQQPTASRSNAGTGHSLLDIYDNHQGFVSDKWTNTLLHYDRIMPQFRDREVRLLEIGVQNGGSLEIWSTYFPLGRIFVGCDIDPACESLDYADPRIKIVCADAAAPFSRTKIMELSGQFDVIIDDGSHRSDDIISTFLQFFPVLAPGGIYVIEDLHCSYWPEYEGGLDLETSALAFFRRLTDVINQEHWRVEIDLAGRFGAFADAYDLEIDADMFQSIVSIEFANSLVVVRKGWPQDSLLGKRRVRGKVAKVHASVLQGDGSFFSASRVSRSSSSARSAPAAIGSDAISLSVVVPFLNGSTYLPEAIRSVQQQTRPAREIIVVDDGSAPNEARWLASFAKDADLRVVTQANTGQGGARNAGMAATTGTHICLLDQDDLFLPHHNEALVESWRATVRNMPKLGMVFADLQMRDETRGTITKGVFPHTANPVPGTIEEYVARDLTMYPCTTMIDRAAALGIGGFDSTLRGFEDDDFYLRLVLAGREIGFCPQIIATWRKHSAQSSQSTDFVRSAETFFRKWLAYSWPADVSPAIARTNLRTRLLVNCRLMQKDRSPYLHSAIRQLEHVVISTPDPAT